MSYDVPAGLQELLDQQAGVVARRQLLTAGLAPHDVKRMLRRHELSTLHPGVYVGHNGEPSWLQHAWAGVLAVWPAALTHDSALRAAEGPGSARRAMPIQVAVQRHRNVLAPVNVTVLRRDHLAERVQWHLGPPRFRYEDAALDVAAVAESDFAALDEIARAVQGRRTTAARLVDTLEGRERIGRRAFLCSVLRDVADGVGSVLEHGYLDRVERPHGLDFSRRQVQGRVGSGVVFRDVVYELDHGASLIVELDGRLHHDSARARDRDLDRDLEVAMALDTTVRLSYGQVFERPCQTAERVGRLLVRLGWQGSVRECAEGCAVRIV